MERGECLVSTGGSLSPPQSAMTPRHTTILLLAPLKKMSGNYSTAVRLRHHFETAGYQCLMEETKTFVNYPSFQKYISARQVQFVLSLHAYHSGVILTDSSVEHVVRCESCTLVLEHDVYLPTEFSNLELVVS